jgi:hypothetical protein
MRSADRRRRFLLGAAAVAFALFALLAFATSWAALAAGWFVFEKRVLALKQYFAYA